MSENTEPKIAGGGLFHLGEIKFDQEKLEESHQLFLECLKQIPDHAKAKEYLEEAVCL